MILSEFWDSKQRKAIHCKTKEEAQKLMYYFDKLGKRWHSGEKYIDDDEWGKYEEKTCYSNNSYYSPKKFYVGFGWQVIDFEDVIAYAEIVSDYEGYLLYDEWFEENGCPELKERFNYGEFTKVGKRYLILKTGLHAEEKTKIFALLDEEENKIYLMGEEDIRLIREGEKTKMIENKFKVGDRVRILPWEKLESKYVRCGFPECMKHLCGKTATIERITDISLDERNAIIHLKDWDDKTMVTEGFSYSTDMVEKVECRPRRSGFDFRLISEVLKPKTVEVRSEETCVWFDECEIIYSFRFNEERKSVTLYKNGEKVQFVKCDPQDKFSWKIGLGVAFYKEFFGKGKTVAPDVAYIKDILNWKMFYTYMVAYALDFDKDKLERLDARVKKAKLYKEIKIND